MACEQDAIWLAYLESKGLLNPDDPAAVEALFSAFPVQPLPVQGEAAAPEPDEKNPFSCDDPTAG
jgi:hypothetical protein